MRVSNSDRESPNPTLKAFQDLLRDDVPETGVLDAVLFQILAEESAGPALHALNDQRPRSNSSKDPHWQRVRIQLETAIQKARSLRINTWQLDPNRRTLRLLMEIHNPASELNPSALGHALAQALRKSEIPFAMGLEKKPRPMVSLGPPLPLGVEGLREWADVVLQEPLRVSLPACVAHVNENCPNGLRLLEATLISNHGSTLLDLAQEARWEWQIGPELRDVAHSRLDTFAAATSFQIEKTGKVAGVKTVKLMEVRSLITDLTWRGEVLKFSTRFRAGEGLSPVKLLAGVLGVEPARIKNLTRTEVILSEDPRLAQVRKYEPKLHNIYEDAVLLESSGDIQPIDNDHDDDDDLLLNR